MADLTEAQLAWLRDELGDQPDDAALQERYERLGSVRDVAIAVWRRRRTDFIASPLSTQLAGVAGVNASENVRAIDRRIAALELLDDDPTDSPGEDTDGGSADDRIEFVQMTRSRRR